MADIALIPSLTTFVSKHWSCTFRVFLLVVLFLTGLAGKLPGQARGQVQRDGGMFNQGRSERGEMRDQGEFGETIDTFGVFPFLASNPGKFERLRDTSLDAWLHQYDPVRQRPFDYLHLGHVGSPHQSMRLEAPFRVGLDLGLHQFDLYLLSPGNMPFYRLEKAYTNVSFLQIGEQAESMLQAQFARNFSDGIHLSLDYRRMNLFGTNKYPEQDIQNTSLGLGLWIQDETDRYDGFLVYTGNTFQQENSGGIKTPPVGTGSFNSAQSAEVFLSETETRHERNTFAYTQYYRLNKVRRDSSGVSAPGRAFLLGHHGEFQSNSFRFFDIFPSTGPSENDLSHYRDFLVDNRGLRFSLGQQTLDNTFSLATTRTGATTANGRLPADQKDLLEAALQHQAHWLDLEDGDTTLQYLMVKGRLNFSPNPGLDIQTYAHLGLWDQAGDYRVSGQLSLSLGRLGRFSAGAINQLYSPTFVQHRFAVSQRNLWTTDGKRTLHTTLQAGYEHPFTRFSAVATYHLINNYIYFDKEGKPAQLSKPLNVAQLSLSNHVRLGNFHLENAVLLQQFSEAVVPLPELFSKHSLYYAGKWFGVLDVKTGLDVRLIPGYQAAYFFPLTGQFQLQEGFEAPFYPAVDVFFAMQVNKFRAFAKFEQVAGLLGNDNLYYQTAYYAHPGSAFRFGIKWRFVN